MAAAGWVLQRVNKASLRQLSMVLRQLPAKTMAEAQKNVQVGTDTAHSLTRPSTLAAWLADSLWCGCWCFAGLIVHQESVQRAREAVKLDVRDPESWCECMGGREGG